MRAMRVLLGTLALFAMGATAVADDGPDYRATLTATTVPMSVNTPAHGEALFWLTKDRQAIRYRLSVADIENVTLAHIHLGKPDATGPAVAWLYPDRPPPKLIKGTFTGVLAEGSIAAGNLVGPLEGRSLDALIADLKEGDAYVNVHSNRYPEGEIRGQVQ